MINKIDGLIRLTENIRKGLFKVNLEMGGSIGDSERRVAQVVKRSEEIFDFLFESKGLFVKVIVWDYLLHGNLKKMIDCGFQPSDSDIFRELESEVENDVTEADKIIYLFYSRYEFQKIKPLIIAVASFELALDLSVNISVKYFTTSGHLCYVNLYDDRGLEAAFTDETDFQNFRHRFKQFEI